MSPTFPVRHVVRGSRAAFATLLIGVASLSAQDRVVLRGRVIDAETRAPIEGAFVTPMGLPQGVLTDSLGLFALPSEPHGSFPLTAERLGYATLQVTLASTAPVEFTTLMLRPNPIALQGLTVLVDRFERRRRFHFGPVRVLDEKRLLRAAQPNVYDLVRTQIPTARICMEDPSQLCFRRRGRIQVAEVCIDEQPAWAGATELEAFSPAELYLVEVYDRGRLVRVYTRWYVEGMLRRGRPLRPLSFGC